MSNLINDTRLADLDKNLREYGRDSKKSDLSKPLYAKELCRAAFDGVIGEDYAKKSLELWLEGRKQVTDRHTILAGTDPEMNEKSFKANASKNMQIIKLGLMGSVDGPELLDKVTDTRSSLVGGERKLRAPFECMLEATRAQLKRPADPLSDDEIENLCFAPEGKTETFIDKLIRDYKAAVKRAEEAADAEGIDEVQDLIDAIKRRVSAIAEEITLAGGEVPPTTKEEESERKALAFLKTRGYSVNTLAA